MRENTPEMQLYEEFMTWFGSLSLEERMAFSDPHTEIAKRKRGLDYYTMDKAKEYFDENILPQRKAQIELNNQENNEQINAQDSVKT
jgi:hypothetical protein